MSQISKMALATSVGMSDRGGYRVLTELSRRFPTLAIVVLSGRREEILGALQSMLGNSVSGFAETLACDDAWPPAPVEPQPAIGRSSGCASQLGLTERQVEVLGLLMRGNSNKEICRVLKLAEPTVKSHVTAILRALKVSNRTAAAVAAGGLGMNLAATA